ncbi:MAG: hypothetical protein KBD36_03910 [Alphaproteobacteria bacterium]|nr:hypothetical protein [Alphaproteobacteria bacterium]MBP9776968.1 hypothetical protein [Alphaproteobacteria bacterium]
MLRYILFLLLTVKFTPLCALEDERPLDPTPLYARRLVSDADHTEFLKQTLNTATKEVMISSYTVSPKRLLEEEIGQAILDAAARGVKVYIYYENRPWYSEEDYADLSMIAEHCAIFEPAINHSKCVIKDRSAVAIGSYNWLSDSRENSSNASIVATGMLTSGLIHDIWQGLRFYQSIKYENVRGQQTFLSDKDAFSTGEYQFAPGQFLYTLRTPEAHGILLDEALEKAKTRVLLFSPFIRLEKLQSTLTSPLLHNLQQRGVHLQLITLPSPCRTPEEQRGIFSLLNKLHTTYPNFSYNTQPDFHAKTLLADDDLICEGSFNWLSAVSAIDHGANNFEMSVSVRGDIAHHMIQAFEGTALGKLVLPIKLREIVSSPKRSRAEQSPENVKRSKSSSVVSSPGSDHLFKTFSGISFGKKGYCARLNGGDYLRDDRRQILYFKTEEEAREAAQALFLRTREETSLDEGSLWSVLKETAERHFEMPRVAPTLSTQGSRSSTDSILTDNEDDIFNDPKVLAELDCLEQEYFSQPQTSSQPTFFPDIFDESSDPFDTRLCPSSDPRPIKVPSSFDRLVKIFSGAAFGRKGYCARFNDGGYLSDDRGEILYFKTSEIAKQAAYATWKQ